MGSASTSAFVVAASIGAVEALKDQGICRWNFVLRSLQQHMKSNVRAFNSQAKNDSSKFSAQYSSVASVSKLGDHETALKQSEESFERVTYFNCWAS